MSFYTSNCHPDKCPGVINTSSNGCFNGINERVCVQVKKVFDACIKQFTERNVKIELDSKHHHGNNADAIENTHCPINKTTFISARSSSSKGIISDLTIETIDACKNLSRVKCNITIPLTVIYLNKYGVQKTGTSSITVCEDVLMCMPETSIIPFEMEAVVSCVCLDGTTVHGKDDEFIVNACITTILKVVVESELLIPSYGYCSIPPSQDYNQEVCAGFFELPLFPRNPKKKGC